MSRPSVGVGVFVWKDGKFLMGKRVGSHGRNTWSIPGGHLEYGESIEECAKREVLEEAGVKIKNVRFLVVTNDVFREEGKHYVTVWVFSDWQSGEPKIMEPDKWIEQRWETFQTLPSPLFEPCWENLRKAKPELFKQAGQQM
jgi:8-oxo-dGTP diphosphatase